MKKNNPIGILDSGVGGLSILREVIKQLPNESTIYFADSKNCPYGPRPIKEISKLAENVVKFLLTKEVKVILVACNTITVSIINNLRNKFDIPFVGVEPATKVAAEKTKTGNIGILATKGTFSGELYQETKDKYANGSNIFIQIGEGLVEIVESNSIEEKSSIDIISKYVNHFQKNNVDQVALGCTHYPFLKNKLVELSENKINFIDPAEAVVKQLTRVLESEKLLSENTSNVSHKIYSSGKLIKLGKMIPEIKGINYSTFENIILE